MEVILQMHILLRLTHILHKWVHKSNDLQFHFLNAKVLGGIRPITNSSIRMFLKISLSIKQTRKQINIMRKRKFQKIQFYDSCIFISCMKLTHLLKEAVLEQLFLNFEQIYECMRCVFWQH